MPHDLQIAFHVSHRYGGDDVDPPLTTFDALLDEVDEDPSDIEHVGIGVVHESGWCIAVHPGWTVVFENVDELDIEPRHLRIGPDRGKTLRLMRAAAEGDLVALESAPWHPGYP